MTVLWILGLVVAGVLALIGAVVVFVVIDERWVSKPWRPQS